MYLLCRGVVFVVVDDIKSSKTLANFSHALQENEIPSIPEEYYETLQTLIPPFDNIKVYIEMYKFRRNIASFNSNIIINIPTREVLHKQILDDLNNRIKLFELYDFLDVDDKYINNLVKEIGFTADEMDYLIEFSSPLLYSLTINYPSLFGSSYYTTLLRKVKFPDLGRFFHQNDSFCSISRYIKNLLMLNFRNRSPIVSSLDNMIPIMSILPETFLTDNQASNLIYGAVIACKSGNIDFLKFYEEYGLNIKENEGVLLGACNDFDMLQFLVKKSCDLNIIPHHNHPMLSSYTCYKHPIFTFRNNHTHFKWIIDQGCEVLHHRVLITLLMENNSLCAEELLQRGKNINTKRLIYDIINNLTPRFVSKYKSKRAEILELVLAHGADINFTQDHKTPLVMAILDAHVQWVDLLLSHGTHIPQNYDVYQDPEFYRNNGIQVEQLLHAIFHGHDHVFKQFYDDYQRDGYKAIIKIVKKYV